MLTQNFLLVLVAFEAVVLVVAWWAARRGDYRVRRRQLQCPLTGERATLDVAETHAAADVLRCSLLERAGVHACDRSCVRAMVRD